MKHKRWTAEEDKIVIQAVKENFENLSNGFRKASKKLDRTTPAIHYRWYYELSNPESKHYIGSTCFLGFGINKHYSNRKNYYNSVKVTPVKQSKSLWNKILNILHIK